MMREVCGEESSVSVLCLRLLLSTGTGDAIGDEEGCFLVEPDGINSSSSRTAVIGSG